MGVRMIFSKQFVLTASNFTGNLQYRRRKFWGATREITLCDFENGAGFERLIFPVLGIGQFDRLLSNRTTNC